MRTARCARGVVVVCLGLLGLGGSPLVSGAAARPNVVVLMTDDQDAASVHVMESVQRELGDAGATFDNSFVSYSLCCPSRATFLTGQYAHNHGATINNGYDLVDHTNALPVWLQRAGYHTAHIGKYLNGYGLPDLLEAPPPGWSEWFGSPGSLDNYYFGFKLNHEGGLIRFPGNAYRTDVYTDLAVDVIERNAPSSQPFFLWVAYAAPHAGRPVESGDPAGIATPVPAPRHVDAFSSEPLPQPASLNETDVSDKPVAMRRLPRLNAADLADTRANYQQRLESLLGVDESVEAIVSALRDSGELDNTLIVFTSDNGFFHGEHRKKSGKLLA